MGDARKHNTLFFERDLVSFAVVFRLVTQRNTTLGGALRDELKSAAKETKRNPADPRKPSGPFDGKRPSLSKRWGRQPPTPSLYRAALLQGLLVRSF